MRPPGNQAFRSSLRSRDSSSTTESDPREKIKDCFRKFVAFMCTQVGVGGLVVCYAIVGAFGFISIETQEKNPHFAHLESLRRNCVADLWDVTANENVFNESVWLYEANLVLKKFQDGFAQTVAKGYDGRTTEEIWSFPGAMMFCLSVFTMIGYGNTVPRTPWGKGVTVMYAGLGIPIYILYFMNMGKVLAQTFKWLYTMIHECSHEREVDFGYENGALPPVRKKIIVPSTACLWVISFYILVGTIMFAEWEEWNYLDSTYFCVTSLCKIGMGDFVPGTKAKDSRSSSQTKLIINFVYMLLGMGLIAMCYNLMREDVRVKARELKEDVRQCLEDIQNRFTRCLGMNRYPRNVQYTR